METPNKETEYIIGVDSGNGKSQFAEMLFTPKVHTVDEIEKSVTEANDRLIGELMQSGSISFGIIGEDGKFTETSVCPKPTK